MAHAWVGPTATLSGIRFVPKLVFVKAALVISVPASPRIFVGEEVGNPLPALPWRLLPKHFTTGLAEGDVVS